jgi:four helix bundle protein
LQIADFRRTAPARHLHLTEGVNEIAEQLKERTTQFAVRTRHYCHSLPDKWDGRHVRDQLFRSATGVAANYHAACRARSHRDFVAKIGIVVEEADETVFWLGFLSRADISNTADGAALLNEAQQLLAIFTKSAKTAGANRS